MSTLSRPVTEPVLHGATSMTGWPAALENGLVRDRIELDRVQQPRVGLGYSPPLDRHVGINAACYA